ncbi:MAG: hypothetical protein FWH15_09090 [Betaproteobacteria bacterium]|nr:hypothetical protein [Betaproteobacteria bacterium]
MKKYLIAILMVLLAGCASIGTQFKAFEEATDGDRARVRVIGNALVKAVPNKSCADWSAPGAGTVLGGIVGSSGFSGRSLGMPPSHNMPKVDKTEFSSWFYVAVGETVEHVSLSLHATKVNLAEFYVEAGKPVTLTLMTTPESNRQCNLSLTFVPDKDKDYEATMLVDYGSMFSSARCVAHVIDLGDPGNVIIVKPTTGRC